jgi:pyrroline-5-carboxylate reductase
MASTLTVGFLGCGRMATALAKGFLRANLVHGPQVVGSDPMESARVAFAEATGGQATADNGDVLRVAEVVLLAVKPEQAAGVLGEVRGGFTERHVLLSLVAGMTVTTIEGLLGGEPRVIRVMPNAPALVGASATGYALGRHALPEDATLAHRLFSAVGLVFQVREGLLDAVTGLSGSGPAYACLVMESMSDGGVAAGLPRQTATQLAAQTLLGSALMVLQTGQHPALLREMVTSSGGTTIEGLQVLEQAGVRSAFMAAVRAAAEKAGRLGVVGGGRPEQDAS